ncbi:PQQ-binding-like beta-propeller repeat protein [Gimesia aquarii]|uniref:Outer membrane biogenesis protein BamB n=1 Tax=Gimesia aquarii TaxID=2527964 RepID=A0A517WVP7_9PLAN|nr:PQQ-binding-like beta-propeller repeat protein [Gimesia aquarii]QDU09336.1 outer membrane biogenesis protein BamB [Gimesia aquarii]
MRSIRLFCLVFCLISGFGLSQIDAAIFSGIIQSISEDQKRVVIKSSQGKEKSFLIPDSIPTTFNGKKTKFDQFKVGQRATVFTSASGTITRFSVRNSTNRSATKSKPKPRVSKRKKEVQMKDQFGSANQGNAPQAWTQFRGPGRANISAETGLLKDWNQAPPKLLWTARGLGEGYSSVSLSGNLLFTMGTKSNEEVVIALDVNTGEIVWSQSNGSIFKDGQGNGPRSTPTIDGNVLYALGANGDLSCMTTRDGNVEWTKNILQEFNASNIVWGISESPLIDGEKLICSPGGQGAAMVALNKQNGATIWKAAVPGNPKAAYSSAIIVNVGGVKQYVNFTHDGIMGVNAKTGTPLWGNNRAANKTANCSAPLFSARNNAIFYASGYGTGGALLKLSASQNRATAQLGFFTQDMKNHHGGMVVVDGFVYGSSDPGVLTCINLSNGETVWQNRSVGKGALTCADGHIYMRSEAGPIALVELSPKAYVEKGRFNQPQRSGKPAWPHPVVADGKLFLRDQDSLLCYDLRSK